MFNVGLKLSGSIMEAPREPHSISLKVLRLSRPSLSQRFPLPLPPKQSAFYIDPNAAFDFGSNESDDQFLINPVLTLPPAFGSAYVGETFSCTLCANNELPTDSERQVTSVNVGAEMQAPSGTIALEVSPSDQEAAKVGPGESLQKIVRFELREQGNHTLAVNLSYSETTVSNDQSASSERVRTFRKLYQFVARPCLGVRTKVSNLPSEGSDDTQSQAARYALEAQIENFADGTITLEAATFNPKPAFESTSLNWDAKELDLHHSDKPSMAPRDVLQIAFLVEQHKAGPGKEVTKDGRTLLGNLDIQWTTLMGDKGFLSTGWLTTKKK